MEGVIIAVLAVITVFSVVRVMSEEYDADGSIQANKRARRKRYRDGRK